MKYKRKNSKTTCFMERIKSFMEHRERKKELYNIEIWSKLHRKVEKIIDFS